jgi:hypothetical protein
MFLFALGLMLTLLFRQGDRLAGAELTPLGDFLVNFGIIHQGSNPLLETAVFCFFI